ncbi:uncharacterized protein B0I36DRAFT_412759, partial [Microdochium trichocladiopsis]
CAATPAAGAERLAQHGAWAVSALCLGLPRRGLVRACMCEPGPPGVGKAHSHWLVWSRPLPRSFPFSTLSCLPILSAPLLSILQYPPATFLPVDHRQPSLHDHITVLRPRLSCWRQAAVLVTVAVASDSYCRMPDARTHLSRMSAWSRRLSTLRFSRRDLRATNQLQHNAWSRDQPRPQPLLNLRTRTQNILCREERSNDPQTPISAIPLTERTWLD